MPVGDVDNQNVRGQIGPATATNLDIERREQTLKIGRLEVAALGSSIARQVRMQPLRTGSDGEHDDPIFKPGRSVADLCAHADDFSRARSAFVAISAAISAQRVLGRSCAMSLNITSRDRGIAAAVAIPPLS